MAKGTTIAPSFLSRVQTTDSSRRPSSSSGKDRDNISLGGTSNISRHTSIITSAVVPYLRRMDLRDDSQSAHRNPNKPPLLILQLSSTSFLDSVVNDVSTERPIYAFQTLGATTAVLRNDPSVGSTKTADIQWPRNHSTKGKGKGKDTVDGVLIQMAGRRWKDGEVFLRPGSFHSVRKFNLPSYAPSLKWKRIGDSYYCHTASLKTPIAILDLASESVPPHLRVYETLHDKTDSGALRVHNGVSIMVLDYLIVTACVLVTDVQEWTSIPRPNEITTKDNSMSFLSVNSSTPNINTSRSTPGGSPVEPMSGTSSPVPSSSSSPASRPTSSTSPSQWRKILYGEPLFPKLSPRFDTHPPRSPTSPNQMAKIIHREPLYPSIEHRAQHGYFPDINPDLDTPSASEDEDDFEDDLEEDLQSPSADSMFYPYMTSTTSTAPSHGYLDPSFYSPPPVPAIPDRYKSASTSSILESTSNSSISYRRRRRRELPIPPNQVSAVPSGYITQSLRSRSTPPRDSDSDGLPDIRTENGRLIIDTSPLGHKRPPNIPIIRTQSQPQITPSLISPTRRRLPQLPNPNPQRPLPSPSPTPRSSNEKNHFNSQFNSRTLPPTPLTVTPHARGYGFASEHEGRSGPPSSVPEEDAGVVVSETDAGTVFDVPPPAYHSINFDGATGRVLRPVQSQAQSRGRGKTQ